MITLLTFGLFGLMGACAVRRILDPSSPEEQLGFGLILGTLAGAWLSLIFYLVFGISWISKSAVFILSFIAVWTLRGDLEKIFSRESFENFRLSYFSSFSGFLRLAGALLWLLFWLRMGFNIVYETPHGILTRIASNYGDQNLNAAYAGRFAWGEVGLANPLFAGRLLNRHFLMSFFLSLFLRENWNPIFIFQAQTFLSGTLFVWAAGKLARRVTGSEACAWMVPLLFVMSGGFGFLPPVRQEMGWPNFLNVTLLPQRATEFTLAAACFVFILIWQGLQTESKKPWLSSGIVTALLPISCFFSFLSTLWIGFSQMLLTHSWKQKAAWLLPLLVIAGSQLLYLFSGDSSASKEFWTQGWLNEGKKGFGHLIFFWLKQTGVLWPVLVGSLFSPLLSGRLKRFGLGFIGLFIIPNILRLTNWDWDTVRILMYWFLGSLLLVTFYLRETWRRSLPLKFFVIIVLGLLMTEGSQKVFKLVKGEGDFQIISRDEYYFAHRIRTLTRPSDIILTSADTNHLVYWSGRVSFMGYAGWVWTGGWGNLPERETEIKKIYEGSPDAIEIIQKHGIDAIVVSAFERKKFNINTHFLSRIGTRIPWKAGLDLWKINTQVLQKANQPHSGGGQTTLPANPH